MNSVALSRAKKRDVSSIGSLGAPTTTTSQRSTAIAGGGMPIPTPPPPNASMVAAATAPQPHSSGSFRKPGAAPLPSIPTGAVSQPFISPKTGKIAAQHEKEKCTRSGSIDVPVAACSASTDTSDGDGDDLSSSALRRRDGSRGPRDTMTNLTQEEQHEAAQVFGQRITQEVLRDQTGFEDLHLVTSTQLVVNARHVSGLEQIGEWMPKLVTLRLNHSCVPSFRDLGIKFPSLQVLNLNNAHVVSLAGVVHAKQLRELYAAFNLITSTEDILPLSGTLEVLDLEGNHIREAVHVENLRCMDRLRCLNVAGNPVCVDWKGTNDSDTLSFSEFVEQCVPTIQFLDDVPIRDAKSRGATTRSGAQNSGNVFADPNGLTTELQLVQASIRNNIDVTSGLEGSIETRHRYLSSRQSTSCGGARRRTPATSSQVASRSERSACLPTATTTEAVGSRAHVNSAPDSLGLGASHPLSSPSKHHQTSHSKSVSSPLKGSGLHTPPPPSTQPSTGSSMFSRSAFLVSSVSAPPMDVSSKEAASSLTSGGSMFTGNLVKSLRRRLPSLTTPTNATKQHGVSDDVLAALNRTLVGKHEVSGNGAGGSGSRTLREHELMERLGEMRELQMQGVAPSVESSAALQQLLDSMDLEVVDFEFAAGNDDALEALKRDEFLRYDEEEQRPKLLDKYKYLLADDLDDDDEAGRLPESAAGNGRKHHEEDLSESEILKEVAKLKMRTLRDANSAMVENPHEFESLQMSDLGGDIDGVL